MLNIYDRVWIIAGRERNDGMVGNSLGSTAARHPTNGSGC